MAHNIYLTNVPTRLISTILELVEGEGIAATVDGKQQQKEMKRHYVNGRRNKGITGRDLVLRSLDENDGRVMVKALEKIFTNHGFAAASYSSVVTNLEKQEKLVRRVSSPEGPIIARAEAAPAVLADGAPVVK